MNLPIAFMSQTPEMDIDYVAALARLELSPQERQTYAAQLGDVLDYLARLNSVDVTGVEPTAHAFPLENVWGEDVPHAALTAAEVVRNAPSARDNQLVVPKVIDEA
ncbi:MAG: Asp-tRNA(Asn)/Glu-tRNA(Gln) amidotransferase subunit GatC [Verrucomicrobiota bacterium]|nr:Asp-tRNA(Asn)/Glu-tRNA(Gln) amidotransferase subunit GatC [Verrucomicrobiota bacterium]